MRSSRSRIAMIGGLACCAALLPVAFAGAVSRSHTASAALCSTSHLEVWLGDGSGGGTAGRTYYPLEFSNVGHSACALYGYPGVSAWALNGVQVGLPATHSGASHSLVTLAPGATAHALLAVVDWGAVCATGVNALGLKVFPPGQKAAQTFSFPLEGCAGKSTLVTGPVRAGVGIPGYTTS